MTVPAQRVRHVTSFEALRTTPFAGDVNALCWERTLPGDYAEVIARLGPGSGIVAIEDARLRALPLSLDGQRAAEAMLADQALLRAHDLAPALNCIYDCVRGPDAGLVPTDVLSFHVDSAPVEVDTWLCTYHGACSEGLANEVAVRKVDQPKIRAALLKEYDGPDDAGFAEFLSDYSYDLHYAPVPTAPPYPFGKFSLWRIATQWPGSPVLPCIHRAPENTPDSPRLLLIS
jgi:hypothetical protein